MLRYSFSFRHGGDSRIFSGVYMDAVKGGPASISRVPPPQKLTFSGQPMPRRSGLQCEVLGLYRQLHKAALQKSDLTTQQNIRNLVRSEFKKEASLSRRNVNKIEWCLNRARTKLEEIKSLKNGVKFALVQ